MKTTKIVSGIYKFTNKYGVDFIIEYVSAKNWVAYECRSIEECSQYNNTATVYDSLKNAKSWLNY
jgi:hypothetical protein